MKHFYRIQVSRRMASIEQEYCDYLLPLLLGAASEASFHASTATLSIVMEPATGEQALSIGKHHWNCCCHLSAASIRCLFLPFSCKRACRALWHQVTIISILEQHSKKLLGLLKPRINPADPLVYSFGLFDCHVDAPARQPWEGDCVLRYRNKGESALE